MARYPSTIQSRPRDSAALAASAAAARAAETASAATRPILRLEDGPGRGAALQLAVAFPGRVGGSVEGEAPVVQHGRPRAQLAGRGERVRNEDEGDARGAEILDAPLALVLEAL